MKWTIHVCEELRGDYTEPEEVTQTTASSIIGIVGGGK